MLFLMVRDSGEPPSVAGSQELSLQKSVKEDATNFSMWEEPSGPRYIVVDER